MSMLKYFLLTPSIKMYRDFKEYNLLRKTESEFSHTCDRLRSALRVKYGLQSEDVTSSNRAGCIVTCFVQQPDFGRDSDPAVSICREVCKDFSDSKSCGVEDCKYYKRNKEYFDALKEYHKARQQRKNFWTQKFSNTK